MVSNALLQELLATMPNAKLVADNRQILCRCPICGDSMNISSAHFYIGPLKDDSRPLQYNCKKCDSSGLFSSSILREMGIYDYEVASELNKRNNEIINSNIGGSIVNYSKSVHNISYNNITDDNISKTKLKYINSRLGINLTYADCIKNKIILNINDILIPNKLNIARHPNIIEQLNTYFIGFLSYDNCFINMRRLCKEGKVYNNIDKRYINYNIFNKIDNSLRFYVLPTNINIFEINPIDVYITEGPFDILSVKYNISNSDHSIYVSVGGKSYIAAIKFIVGYLGLINISIHLCPDADIDDYQMYNICQYISPFNLSIDMMRNSNTGEKDFGVSKDLINLSVTKLN